MLETAKRGKDIGIKENVVNSQDEGLDCQHLINAVCDMLVHLHSWRVIASSRCFCKGQQDRSRHSCFLENIDAVCSMHYLPLLLSASHEEL